MDEAKNKGLAVKIIIPALIACVIAAIFIFKNAANEQENPALNIPLTITKVNMEEVTAHGLPIIIDFDADSCIPCKEMAPVLIKLNEEMQGKAVIHFVDVWKNPEAAQDFPVQVIPTQVFVTADGKPYPIVAPIFYRTRCAGAGGGDLHRLREKAVLGRAVWEA